jgi:OmpR-family two-component system manganese-sensing sensor histidine kinase
LVDDLLFLTRQESGLVSLQRHPVRLDTVLAEVVEEQTAIAQEAGITLTYQSPGATKEQAGTIQGDRDQLIRLFTNLVSNGLQYTPAGGTVAVTLAPSRWQNQGAVAVQVKDTGQGIAPEALPHVFDRFYRADPARPRPQRSAGSGLGLAIAKVIVDNHRGEIRLDSTPAQGTTVSVWLPALLPTDLNSRS